jgi:hypothetical protein
MKLRPRQKVLALVALLALAVIFLPSHLVNALDLTGITSNVAGSIFSSILVVVFGLVGTFIAFMAKMLSLAVIVRAGGNIPVIGATWKIFRDFSNMLFILVLIYVAFATIFDQGNYTFKSMIVRLIVVAVLINFSLVIGNLVIDACQVLSNVFLGSIGNLGDRLGTVLNPTLLQAKNISGTDLATGSVFGVLFALVLGLIFLFSLLVATAFAIIRIPMIWGLLIISPFAWMAYILPGAKHRFEQWWSLFIGWNLFLPIYLMFMYFGLLFLSKQGEVLNQINQMKLTGTDMYGGFTFNILFFYLFAAFIMLGGTYAAAKVTSELGGSGFGLGLGWARTFVGKATGYDIRATAVKEAAQARLGQVQQEGFRNPWLNKVYGGKAGDDRIKAAYMDRARVGNRDARETQLAKDVASERNHQKAFANNIPELRNLANTGSTQQKIAARMRLAELGALDTARMEETYGWLGGDRSEAANKFMGGIDFMKLSDTDRERLLKSSKIADIEIRKKIITAMIEKDKLSKDRIEELINQIAIRDGQGQMLNMGQLKDILDKGNKKNMLAVAEVKADMGFESKPFKEVLEDSLKKMNDDQILETMNEFNLPSGATNDFTDALEKVFEKNPKRLETLASKAAGDTAARLDELAKDAKSKINAPKIDKEVKKRDRAVDSVQTAASKLDNLEKQIRGLQGQIALNPSPSSDANKKFKEVITKLEKERDSKGNDIKALNDKIDKMTEKIEDIASGTTTTP